jgi:hypothetical protein
MRSFHVTCVALLAVLAACASPTSEADESSQVQVTPAGVDPQGNQPAGPHGKPEPEEAPMLGLHHAKDASHKPGGSALMTSHGGAIMTSSVVTPIFLGASWSNATFAGDKIDGINRLYAGLASASTYVASNTEYTGTNGRVGAAVTSTASITDLSAAPRTAPLTSAINAEVCKVIGANGVANGYYPVYTDTKRGSAGYCAWHSYGTCSGVPVQFAFFFNLDGDAGCDPKDTDPSHSQGLAAIASVTGHEWSETVTDPRNGGWWDSAGNENGDKCAWSFPTTRTTTTVINPKTGAGDSWKIQGNWSNAAYTAGTGYPNTTGQKGCLPN